MGRGLVVLPKDDEPSGVWSLGVGTLADSRVAFGCGVGDAQPKRVLGGFFEGEGEGTACQLKPTVAPVLGRAALRLRVF